MQRRMKCYTYIRVSTEMQVDGYSLEAQKDKLDKYAKFQNMDIVGEYCDAGKSGKSITGRPEFTRMLDDIAEGKDSVDFVLVFKLSRFGRNAADVLNSLQHIQDFGVNLICVEDGIDSSKDSGKLTITVLSAVAEIERENILVQTMEGRKQKAREGKWNGGPAPFGYDLDVKNSTLTINEEEAEIVKIVYNKFAYTSMGLDGIARYLNQRGYTKTKNRRHEITYFGRSTIKHMLDNPVYIGKIAYGKKVTEKVKGTRDQYRRIATDDYLLAEGLHDAIIDDKLWADVRTKREETGIGWVKTHSLDHEHILSGIIKCPICGCGMAGTVRRRKNKKTGDYKDDFYYRCLHRKMVGDHYCDFKLSLNQNELNAEVEHILLDMIQCDAFKNFIVKKMDDVVDVSTLESEKEQLKNQLRQVVGAKRKLTEQLDKLDVGDKHYDRKYQDMQDRMDNLYDKISEIEGALSGIEEQIKHTYERHFSAKDLYQILENFDKLYVNMSDLEKKEFFQNFIEYIELLPEKNSDGRILKHIRLKFPVYYNGEEKEDIRLLNGETVETVALLSRKKNGPKIEVEMNLTEADKRVYVGKATYQQIKDYILAKYGVKVHTQYIAEIKRKCGLDVSDAFNKVENPKQVVHCSEEKEKYIREALAYFGMIK